VARSSATTTAIEGKWSGWTEVIPSPTHGGLRRVREACGKRGGPEDARAPPEARACRPFQDIASPCDSSLDLYTRAISLFILVSCTMHCYLEAGLGVAELALFRLLVTTVDRIARIRG
jgi:hypothetical protein